MAFKNCLLVFISLLSVHFISRQLFLGSPEMLFEKKISDSLRCRSGKDVAVTDCETCLKRTAVGVNRLRLLKFRKLFIEVNSPQGFGCRIHVAALLQAKCHKVYVTVKGTSSLRWIIEKRIGTVRQKRSTVPMPKKIFRAYFTLARHRSMRRLIALQITVHLPRLIYYISSIVFLGTLIIFIQISTEKIIKTFTRSEEWIIR